MTYGSGVWAWFAARARVLLGSTLLLARALGENGRSSREARLLKVSRPARRALGAYYLVGARGRVFSSSRRRHRNM